MGTQKTMREGSTLLLIYFFVNFPSGGLALLPVARRMDFVGQASIQVPQAKQSGMVLSRFRIAPITVEGHAFSQERHPMQV